MKKLHLKDENRLRLKEGCDRYLDDCRQRNLREGTITHYRQSYLKLFTFINEDFYVDELTENTYKDYVLFLKSTLHNDVSINAYLRDFITTLHFFMSEGWIPVFKMKSISVDKTHIQTYSDAELKILLAKPNANKCSFTQYQCWVITSFLFSTGVRQRSLINIRIKDVDFEQRVVHVNVTKNRKALIVPIDNTLSKILKEYLQRRPYNSDNEYLFCNVFGQQLTKSTCYHMLYIYNKGRGVETTGIHRYRHTFAKQWIINGGNVVTLSHILGHSSIAITENYINMLVSDIAKDVDNIDLLNKFGTKQKINLNRKK